MPITPNVYLPPNPGMESARPLGTSTTSPTPSIFDVLAHESTTALLPRLLFLSTIPSSTQPYKRFFKIASFVADLIAIWWGKGRLTELLFGIERDPSHGMLKYLLERAAEEVADRFKDRFSPVRRVLQVMDVACKLLYCTSDSPYYGLLKAVLRIPYHQPATRPNGTLRWILFWGQAAVMILTRIEPKRSVMMTSHGTHHPSSLMPSTTTSTGKCPGCLVSLEGKEKLFMHPGKGIAHCSLSCIGAGAGEGIITLHL